MEFKTLLIFMAVITLSKPNPVPESDESVIQREEELEEKHENFGAENDSEFVDELADEDIYYPEDILDCHNRTLLQKMDFKYVASK